MAVDRNEVETNEHSWHLAINTNNKLDATYSTNGTDVNKNHGSETCDWSGSNGNDEHRCGKELLVKPHNGV